MMELVLKKQESVLLQVFLGSVFIALCAVIQLPTLPVVTSLQTFAIFMLALTIGPEKTFFSALLYLAEATVGLPVLCGASDPFWLLGIRGGYLLAMPFAGYLIGKVAEKKDSNGWRCFAIFCGQLVIYSSGFIWLANFIGPRSAFIHGVLFFIPSGLLKMIIAVSLAKKIKAST